MAALRAALPLASPPQASSRLRLSLTTPSFFPPFARLFSVGSKSSKSFVRSFSELAPVSPLLSFSSQVSNDPFMQFLPWASASASRLPSPPHLPFSLPFFASISIFIFLPRTLTRRTQDRNFKISFGRAVGAVAGPTRHSRAAMSCAVEESSDGEYFDPSWSQIGVSPKNDGFLVLNAMEERGLRADFNTYSSLLDVCLSSGSLVDAKRIHSKILKLGFLSEEALSGRLIDAYLNLGVSYDAARVFDDMPLKTFISWNQMIVGLSRRRDHCQVLSFFSRICRECLDVESVAFATALRASNEYKSCLNFVQQIHGKIIRHGLNGDPVVGNPLIDLYAKNGYISSASLVFDELWTKDYVSWVAMASGFSQNGHGDEAVRLYSEMHRAGIVPTPYILSSVLSACTKTDLFELGEVIHAQVFKQGFCFETFVGNALVTLYSRSGDLRLAEQAFSEMPSHDAVTYNTLISGHAQHGSSDGALEIFRMMQLSGFRPNSGTIASLLTACSSIRDIEKGNQLHCNVLKVGLSSEYIIEGSLLDLYVKCSDVETAHKFFNTTDRENVVLWNVMLVAYGQLGDLRNSFNLFSQMQIKGIYPNQYTYPSILKTCTYCNALDLGEQIHNLAIKTEFHLNTYVCSVLIDMYSKCGKLERARRILDRLTVKDVVSWTTMIAGYAQHDFFSEALKTFQEMCNHGVEPDNIGLASAISACAGIRAIDVGLQIYAQACVSGNSTDISILNSLTNLYARCGRIEEAYSAFRFLELKDEISWNGLISGFAQSGNHEEALKVFEQMDKKGIKANLFTFGSALSASANITGIKQGMQIHAKIIKSGFTSETEASNALISLYSKCGCIEDAKLEFFGMLNRNEISWNAMITGFSQHGRGHEALKLFAQMKEEQLEPNDVTFIGVLAACSHVGLVDEGLSYFKSMTKEHGIVPRSDHYACVVDILGRAGKLERARAFVEEMAITIDAMVWRTLLSACAVHKNIELGELAAKHLLQLEPEDSANYVLLSNIYAVTRKWSFRDQVRQLMKNRGVKKEPGSSWIEVKNVVHSFFVGDRLHAQSDAIYKFLEDLNSRAAEIGYKLDEHYLLHDIEQVQKNPTSYIHSEKLAVAFGLMSLSPEVTLCVIKNLRVCNDCHTWMKFVSKVAGRPIVLRDPYRFHHFDGGYCSCGDYW